MKDIENSPIADKSASSTDRAALEREVRAVLCILKMFPKFNAMTDEEQAAAVVADVLDNRKLLEASSELRAWRASTMH